MKELRSVLSGAGKAIYEGDTFRQMLFTLSDYMSFFFWLKIVRLISSAFKMG